MLLSRLSCKLRSISPCRSGVVFRCRCRSASYNHCLTHTQTQTRHRLITIQVHNTASEQDSIASTSAVGSGQRTVRVHYYRKDQYYEGWGLHVAGDPAIETDWQHPLQPSPADGGWVAWQLDLPESGRHVELIVHKGEEKSVTCRVSEWQLYENTAVWLVAGEGTAYFQPPRTDSIAAGDLSKCCAHWLTPGIIGWREPVSDAKGARMFELHFASQAGMAVAGDGVHHSECHVPLAVESEGLPQEVTSKFPHLSGLTALRLPDSLPVKCETLLTGQLAVVMKDSQGNALDATGVQVAGVLDCLYTYDGALGCHVSNNAVAMHLWAPTAQVVGLLLYDTARGPMTQEAPMTRDGNGVWSAEGPSSWLGKYYKYRIKVYCPWTQQVETSEATDPYSRSLAANSSRSHIVSLSDVALEPPGWKEHVAPALDRWTDISIYELHVRDFSASDQSVPEQLRGKYLAFAEQASDGVKRLRELSDAGLTHIHLLPSYDFGSAPERTEEQLVPEGDLSSFPPDSEAQQTAVLHVADRDAFNWGYDPVHYGVPEGSYSTNPDGSDRILEYRSMVQGLHKLGLRVVCDVVYNHTFATGPHSQFSVLDKCVPGYYHRREENGDVCMSTCCNNTASEHNMFERLMLDDVVHWAKTYKVDGFRFDIMGHHMCTTMYKIRAALDALTLNKDGVDGRSIYIYGEAWDFGEVAFNQRGRNASQLNIAGTGLGSFNDRFRDAIMGGGPFAPSKMQGLVTGLLTDPNAYTQGDMLESAQKALLLEQADLLQLGLAGNLRNYIITDRTGAQKRGLEVMYYGSTPAAYADQPCETVNYASCHDNQTLFDQVMMKAPESADITQRTRMCMLANALTALAQGIPFFHAADEFLRSKSLDRDSYNSGDWFNKIDWTGRSNNFGVGLPVATKNEYNWPIMRPLLADTSMQPSSDLIQLSRNHFLELLQVRYSSPLFHLPTSDDVCALLKFSNTGPHQDPGVLVVHISSADTVNHSGGPVDPEYRALLCVFNAKPTAVALPYLTDITGRLSLHPIMEASCDATTASSSVDDASRSVTVPARTAAVFVERR